jgi:hypothetical protein
LNREDGAGRFDPVMECPNEGHWKNESHSHPDEQAVTIGTPPRPRLPRAWRMLPIRASDEWLLGFRFFNGV